MFKLTYGSSKAVAGGLLFSFTISSLLFSQAKPFFVFPGSVVKILTEVLAHGFEHQAKTTLWKPVWQNAF